MSRRCDITGVGAQVGHHVSHANNKTLRRFQPNLQRRGLLSDALGMLVTLRVSNAGLRTVEKHGGLDAYLLATANSRLTDETLKIKKRVQSAISSKQPA